MAVKREDQVSAGGNEPPDGDGRRPVQDAAEPGGSGDEVGDAGSAERSAEEDDDSRTDQQLPAEEDESSDQDGSTPPVREGRDDDGPSAPQMAQRQHRSGRSAPLWILVLYLGGLALVFMGQRVLGSLGTLSTVASALGVAAVVIGTTLRFSPRFRVGGQRKQIESWLGGLSVTGLVGLLLYFMTTDWLA